MGRGRCVGGLAEEVGHAEVTDVGREIGQAVLQRETPIEAGRKHVAIPDRLSGWLQGVGRVALAS